MPYFGSFWQICKSSKIKKMLPGLENFQSFDEFLNKCYKFKESVKNQYKLKKISQISQKITKI